MVNALKPKVYFISDTEQIIGRHRMTLRRMWMRNEFPRPILINNRLAWHADAIEEWINQNLLGGHNEKASS